MMRLLRPTYIGIFFCDRFTPLVPTMLAKRKNSLLALEVAMPSFDPCPRST